MSSPDELEHEQCLHIGDVLQGSCWTENNRLALNGRSVTLMVFGVIDDCLWRTAKDRPLELRLQVQFLRKSHQHALTEIFRLAEVEGTLTTLQHAPYAHVYHQMP